MSNEKMCSNDDAVHGSKELMKLQAKSELIGYVKRISEEYNADVTTDYDTYIKIDLTNVGVTIEEL